MAVPRNLAATGLKFCLVRPVLCATSDNKRLLCGVGSKHVALSVRCNVPVQSGVGSLQGERAKAWWFSAHRTAAPNNSFKPNPLRGFGNIAASASALFSNCSRCGSA